VHAGAPFRVKRLKRRAQRGYIVVVEAPATGIHHCAGGVVGCVVGEGVVEVGSQGGSRWWDRVAGALRAHGRSLVTRG
jgi:hypothetical protein